MGTIYERGTKLWIGYFDQTGKRICRSSGYNVGQEKLAQALLDEIERRIAEQMKPPVVTGQAASELVGKSLRGPQPSAQGPTVEEYAEKWLASREGRVASMRDERGHFVNHINPRIGSMLIRDVKPRHIRDFVLDLKQAKIRKRGTGKGEGETKIAPRTVRHVYAVLHRFFKSAVIDEMIEANPVVVEKGVLPKNIDKDPSWRSTAVFDREEVIALIADHRIAQPRRVLNALKALATLRHGEAAGLRWSDYHANLEPLGRFVVERSYDNERTKTQVTREVPVHPALACFRSGRRQAGGSSGAETRSPMI